MKVTTSVEVKYVHSYNTILLYAFMVKCKEVKLSVSHEGVWGVDA
jgi:hypothetical protein